MYDTSTVGLSHVTQLTVSEVQPAVACVNASIMLMVGVRVVNDSIVMMMRCVTAAYVVPTDKLCGPLTIGRSIAL